jgi:signal transduction histidine kinase
LLMCGRAVLVEVRRLFGCSRRASDEVTGQCSHVGCSHGGDGWCIAAAVFPYGTKGVHRMGYVFNPERRPAKEAARQRMREAQRLEAVALDAVTRAERRIVAAQERARQVMAASEATVATAQHEHATAIAALVGISGVDRAALLVSQSAADVRKAVRIAGTQASGSADREVGRPTDGGTS